MKKILFMGLILMACVSCRSDYATLSEMFGTTPVNNSDHNQNIATTQETGTVSVPRTAQPHYLDDADRFRHNIVMKASGEDYVVYEYSDVRIDDVASLASRFCFDTTQGKKAYLRDIYMMKNHKRRATFDCVHLASQ